MEEYSVKELKNYIEKSESVIYSDSLHIRLSKELLEKYNQGLYSKALNQLQMHINQINALGIKYSAQAEPIFYIYIVPDNNFAKLLTFPLTRSSKGGGRPVTSYDLDGFYTAFGLSNNMLENRKEANIMQEENNVHELSHIVYSMFANGDRFLNEGFAEALPLYTMDYENIFDEHREMIKTLTEDQILTAEQLIDLAINKNFNTGVVIPDKSCSFDVSYVSSYLFVRGCLETISDKFNLDKMQTTQKFLEIVMQSNSRYINQWLVYDIANAIGIPQEELFSEKEMQLKVIEKFQDKKIKTI